jgi:molecular chaperone DnaK
MIEMENTTVNLGIDLGTTNSSIAAYRNGEVEVFKNPAGQKETLPSVVAFRNDRIIVGDKAREYITKDPRNVIAGFKRKMGTSEKYLIPNLNAALSPTDLSAYVLQELQRFIYTGTTYPGAVITIPAAFDTLQSNATKQAGYKAGFSEVALLQEPIAASLAFVNRQKNPDLSAKWIVYDLGGGTFDVALVHTDVEMKVVDHEGDNFFGGLDFDNLIIDRIIIPRLTKEGDFSGIKELRSAGSRYNALYYKLLHKAEELKITLSAQETADLEITVSGADDEEREFYYLVRRDEFEALITPAIERSIQLLVDLVARNNLSPSDIRETVLIGGSTYIPLVRRLIPEMTGIPVNCSIDPTTAVAVGAAFYASSVPVHVKDNRSGDNAVPSDAVAVKTGYARYSQDKEEYFNAAVSPVKRGQWYRIIRKDGGFDTGVCPLTGKIGLMLPLLPDAVNQFECSLYDSNRHRLPVVVPPIEIVQGLFAVQGQPLPDDICIEVDDMQQKSTMLYPVFEKNALLPLRKTITRTISRTMLCRGDDRLLINVVEGSRYSAPGSCIPLGFIEIKAGALTSDLIKGCDIELCFEMSESRDLKITAYIPSIDHEVSRVFNPNEHSVSIVRLIEELEYLHQSFTVLLNESLLTERFEESVYLQKRINELVEWKLKAVTLKDDDVSDEKYSLEAHKRKISKALDVYNNTRLSLGLKEEYYDLKSGIASELQGCNDDFSRKRFQSLTADEKAWLQGSSSILQAKINGLRSLQFDIKRKNFDWVLNVYYYYAIKSEHEYSDPERFYALQKQASEVIAMHNAAALMSIANNMFNLLIDKNKDNTPEIVGTGIA